MNQPLNSIPVWITVDDPDEEAGKDATCVARCGDTEVTFSGDKDMLVECASAVCHIFNVEISDEATELFHAELYGEIPLSSKGKAPHAEIRIAQHLDHENAPVNQISIKLGDRAANYGIHDVDSARYIASGIAQLLNIPEKGTKQRLWSGPVNIGSGC